ncbi:Choline/ethanolamine kinase [Aspergillus sclerotialis]|uniref:Choline/ethanolamine kinase n=1 Tax=Aspergillus sclerotialis TaxID=2070753 RepID=A0A3A2ZBX1_9EURO|nr:Choline/ethanolamine kinase [Aspergillus sclerotialis]
MQYVDGIGMSELLEEEKEVVCAELCQHLAALHEIKRDMIGGPSGIVIPPYRVMRCRNNDTWIPRSSENSEYVFCHNDLSQHNVIVDRRTLKINAIIDWEYAGFFPRHFEAPFYKRPGPSVALNRENDDVPKLLQFFEDISSE